MANTTTSIVTHVVSFYDKDLLDRALPHLVHTWFGQVRDIPQNASDTIKFRRYNRLTAATTPLTEGTTPAGSTLSVTDVTATASQYGDFVTLTDELETETEDPIIVETNKLLGEQAGDTFDQLCRDVLVTGTTIQYAGAAISRATISSTMKISLAEIKEAVRTLKNNNTKKITSMIDPVNAVDTKAVNSCFIAIVHPNTTYDLKAEATFVPVEQYPNQADVMPGEVGKMDEVRFIETTNAKVFPLAGTAVDVYATLIMGADAYGVTRVAGHALQTITHPLGSAGTGDPLNQRSTHGWKGYFVAKILNESWILRLEHAVSS